MENKEAIFIGIFFLIFAGIAFWLLAAGWDRIEDLFFIETVYAEANYEEIKINRPANTIHLAINGNGNIIEVTGETFLRRLEINGRENLIKLCEGKHDPEILNNGVENEVIFSFC